MTNFQLQTKIPDIGLNMYEHLKGWEVSILSYGQKYFTIKLNRIIQVICSGLSNSFFYLQRFKLFQILVARNNKSNFPPFKLAHNKQPKIVPMQIYHLSID